jgi:hypothetical protein
LESQKGNSLLVLQLNGPLNRGITSDNSEILKRSTPRRFEIETAGKAPRSGSAIDTGCCSDGLELARSDWLQAGAGSAG